jgi:hypothetical protein
LQCSLVVASLVKIVKDGDDIRALWLNKSVIALIKWMLVGLLELVVEHQKLLSPVSVLCAEVGIKDVVLPIKAVDFVVTFTH